MKDIGEYKDFIDDSLTYDDYDDWFGGMTPEQYEKYMERNFQELAELCGETTQIPSFDDYIDSLYIPSPVPRYSEPKCICPKCKQGAMRKRLDLVYITHPPMYEYKCDECEHIEYLFK